MLGAASATASPTPRRSAHPARGTTACPETSRRRSTPVIRRLARERERIEQLQLVVEVVLEPERHLQPIFQRLGELPVAPLERGEDRAPAAPAAVREECRARPQQLRTRNRLHRSLVKNILPRQNRTTDRGLPQRVAGALTVRHVQDSRARARLPPPPGEVCGATGAVVERVTGAADDARELFSHPPQTGDPRIDLVDLRRHPHAQLLRWRPRTARGAQVLRDLREREADLLRLLDRTQEAN